MVRGNILLLCFTMGIAIAQQMPGGSLDGMLEAAKNYYNNGEYEKAINELEKALQYLKQLKQSDKVEAYKYLAFSYVAFGNNDKAKETFKKALELNPHLELDPATVSPKIIKVFEEAKSEMKTVEPIEPTPTVEKPEKPVQPRKEVSKVGATFRSCLLPGWGQLYKGQSSKGKKFLIAGGVTGGLSILTLAMREISHSNYLDADPHDPAEIKDDYKTYKFWFNASTFSLATFLGIYVYNLFDVVLSKPAGLYSTLGDDKGFCYTMQIEGVKLGYKIRF